METSNVSTSVSSLQTPPTFQPQGRGETDSESVLQLFDQIWIKLLELAKQLRDVMRSYSEVKQMLSWNLQTNAFQTQMNTIDKAYNSSILNGVGAIFSGVLTGGFGMLGGETGIILGQSMGHTAGGLMGVGAAVQQRDSDISKATGELQQNGLQSYNKNMTEVLDKASEIMHQIMSMGSSMVDVLAQMLRSLMR